jgi:hypothetical protein
VQDLEREPAAVVTRNPTENALRFRIDGMVLAVEHRAPSELAERQDEARLVLAQIAGRLAGFPQRAPVASQIRLAIEPARRLDR